MTMFNSTAAAQNSTNVRAAIGLLTFAQVAAELPVVPALADLAVKRLVARGSIKVASNPTIPQAGISVESLRDFMENGAANRALRAESGAPPETLLPIFVGEGDGGWFNLTFVSHLIDAFRSALTQMIQTQMPPSYDEMLNAVKYDYTKWGDVTKSPGNAFVPAELTPEIKALIQKPIDLRQITAKTGKDQVIHFRNAGELFLVTRLQAFAVDALIRKQDQERYSGNVSMAATGAGSLSALYSHPGVYAEILTASINAVEANGGASVLAHMSIPPLQGYSSPRQFGMYVSDAAIMQAAGTTSPRLAALAF